MSGERSPPDDRRPSAAVVLVGDELLSGDTADRNGPFLASRLTALGFRVVGFRTVGDDPVAIQRAIERSVAEVVLTTGGLGPTEDDRTREAVARWAGRSLRVDPQLVEALEKRFRERGYTRMPESNLRQAAVLDGGRVLPDPRGSAPAQALEHAGRLVVLLPGIPWETEALFTQRVEPLLRESFSGSLEPPLRREIATTGVAESALATDIEGGGLVDLARVALAYLPSLRGVRLRLTARDEPGAVEALDEAERALEAVVGPYRIEDPGDLAEALVGRLRRHERSLATAESCTGGGVGARVTAVPGASDVYLGGIVAYDNRIKVEQLGVDASLIEAHGAVSEEVAEAMVQGACSRLGADSGVSVTGVAGPGGGTAEKPVGTVCYAATAGSQVIVRRERFPGLREDVRERSTEAALSLLYRLLEGDRGLG